MDELTLYIQILEDIFSLKYAVKVKQRKRHKIKWGGFICEGLYHGEYLSSGKIRHTIDIAPKIEGEHLFAVLAHEYAHAYQMENEPDSDLGHTEEGNLYFKSIRYYIMMEFDIDIEGWY